MKIFDDIIWAIYRFYKYDLRYLHKHVYWFFQRGVRGWSDNDARCLDTYLAKIVRDSTKYLQNNYRGIPYGYNETDWKLKLKFVSKTYNTYLNIVNDNYGIYFKYVKKYGKKAYLKRWRKLKKDMSELINIFEKI